MPRISILVTPEALSLIDSVAGNRTEFMVEAALVEARKRRRELEDAEIARICREQAQGDAILAREFDATLTDGLE